MTKAKISIDYFMGAANFCTYLIDEKDKVEKIKNDFYGDACRGRVTMKIWFNCSKEEAKNIIFACLKQCQLYHTPIVFTINYIKERKKRKCL